MKNACFLALLNAADSAVEARRRNCAETLLGYSTKGPFDTAIAGLLRNLARYADDHATRYEAPIAEYYVLGEAWKDQLASLRAMLIGELGRLDGGDTERAILAVYAAAGFGGEL